MNKEVEIQITINKLIEIIYEMYLKDLKTGNISKVNSLKTFKKLSKKKVSLRSYEIPKLFNYDK